MLSSIILIFNMYEKSCVSKFGFWVWEKNKKEEGEDFGKLEAIPPP